MKKIYCSVSALFFLILWTDLPAQSYQWAKAISGTSAEHSNCITTDASGNVYIAGYFQGSVDFDPGGGAAYLTSAGGKDIFFAKYSSAGAYIWAKSLGGSQDDEAISIALDPSGNVVLAGHFSSSNADFDPGSGTASLNLWGSYDIFYAKYTGSGNYIWAYQIPSSYGDYIGGMSLDNSGNIYLFGEISRYIPTSQTASADLDPSSGSAIISINGQSQLFAAKYDSSGTYQWDVDITSGAWNDVRWMGGISVDASGNASICGSFTGTMQFNGSYTITASASGSNPPDIYYAGISPTGAVQSSATLGGSSDDIGKDVAKDAMGNMYLAGIYGGLYISKVGAWNIQMGSTFAATPYDINVNGSGVVYVTGTFTGTIDFDPGSGVANLVSNGSNGDIFFASYDSNGNYLWAKKIGGTGNETGYGITPDLNGNILLTGDFASVSDFDPGSQTINLTPAGGNDIFIARYCNLNLSLSTSNVTCYGSADGSIDVTVTGGNMPFNYTWSNGAVTEDLYNLSSGTFSLTFTDNSACVVTTSSAVTQPAQLLTSVSKTDVSCTNTNDGSIDLAASGGTSPYTYYWSNGEVTEDINNLSGGTFDVTVTDANGCIETNSITINALPPLSSSITGINPSCSGTNNGQADLDVTGGAPNYFYAWSSGDTTQDLTSLGPGTYYVTITDNNACTIVDSVTLTSSANFTTTVSKTDISCNGLCDGEAAVSITGGTSPYTISWNTTPVQTTATATGLCDGTYTVNVSDANNCQSTPSVTIVEPQAISFSENIVNSDCGSNNGSVTVSVSGGVSPYSFAWSNGQTDSVATGLAAGAYTYTMTDAGGCSQSGSVDIVVAALSPEICLVTVDSTSSKNVVVWEKPIAGNIDSFRVYRDIVGAYTYIGGVAYTDLSKFVDTTNGINPNITSYKYKIASVDTCGNISPLSDFHKTIHLQINGANLTWDNYAGFSTSFYYRILRDTFGIGNFIVLDSVPNTNFTWTDILPPVISGAGYIVEIVHPLGGCTVTKSVENHNSSRSNKTFAAPPGTLPVADFSGNNLNINVGGSVNFTDMTANNPTTWNWTFSGGNPPSSTQQNPANITYNTAGCFDVKLVASNAGGSDSIIKTCYINVTSSGNVPVADFIASNTNISTGGSVDFLDFSTNNPTSWKWLFSGGSPAFSLTQNPVAVVYNNSGCFDVTLIASNSNGSDTLLKSCYINVSAVGMDEFSAEDGIAVFPNPSKGKFTVQGSGPASHTVNSIKIYNVLGEVIFMAQAIRLSSPLLVDLSNRGEGIYFLQIIAADKVFNKRIVIE